MISSLGILNLFSIVFSIAFQIILVRFFGAASQTDVYYLTINIIQFVFTIHIGFITDLYIPIYNDIKTRSMEDCQKFTGGVLLMITLTSLLISVLVAFAALPITRLFATGFSAENIYFAARMVQILSLTIFFNSITMFLNATLNANFFLSITYISNAIPPLFNLMSLLFLAKSYGMIAIIYSLAIASMLNFIILFAFFILKIEWKVTNPFTQPDIKYLLKKNLPIRAGVWIYHLQAPITSNVLSYFPIGYITLFNYASSILSVLLRLITTSTIQVLHVNISNLLALHKLDEAKSFLISTIKNNVTLFMCLLMPTVILFKEICRLILFPRVTLDQISIMFNLFLALSPLYFILSMETPFVTTTLVMKNGKKMIHAAAVFILYYGICLIMTLSFLKVYALPVALLFAQMQSIIIYARFVQKKLQVIEIKMTKLILFCIIFMMLMIAINLIISDNSYFTIILNSLLIFAWFISARKEIKISFQFMMKKNLIKK